MIQKRPFRFKVHTKFTAAIGIIFVILTVSLYLGITKMDQASIQINRSLNNQVRLLAKANQLQSLSHQIRITEAEIPQIKDYFAILGFIEKLQNSVDELEVQLSRFLKEIFSDQDFDGSRIQDAWLSYKHDLERVMEAAIKMDLKMVDRISTYSSQPRFQSFSILIDQITLLSQQKANKQFSESISKQKQTQKLFSGFLVVGIILSVTFIYFFARQLSLRIIDLKKGAENIARGVEGLPLKITGNDEISDLAQSFNDMRDQILKRESALKNNQMELEKRVEERTLDLHKSNKLLESEILKSKDILAALQQSETSLKRVQEIAGLGSWVWDFDEDIITWSDQLFGIMGENESQAESLSLDSHLTRYHRDDRPIVKKLLQKAKIDGELPAHESRIIRLNNQERIIWSDGKKIHAGKNNKKNRLIVTVQDITERRVMEEKLFKARKMEAVGFLAGGIAHDFNNILSIIMGNLSLLEMYHSDNPKSTAKLNEISKAVKVAKELAWKLVTFSKGGAPVKKLLSISDLIADICSLILTGSNVKLVLNLEKELWNVMGDEGQLTQVFQNIVLNAKDAMPGGGPLNVSACNLTLSDNNTFNLDGGDYVKVDIQDSGIGIDKKNISRIFDLYYSSKGLGAQKGAGLGLALSLSVVNKHGGHIDVKSELGEGTVFSIFLPGTCETDPNQTLNLGELQKITWKGDGTVLIMDDEPMVRSMASELFESMGYQTKTAKNGETAIDLYTEALRLGNPFDIVMLDLTVRDGLGGLETINQLKKLDPPIKAIVASGYSEDPVVKNFKRYGFIGALAKPFSREELASLMKSIFSKKTPQDQGVDQVVKQNPAIKD